jgi:dTDP-4-amino-4,6-dideoxygalactose transaminase
MKDGVTEALQPVFDSGYIGQGPQVEAFEANLKMKLSTDYAITTNSGTSAAHLALRLINLQPGDEVLTTPLTCTATNWPLMAAGAKIKWVDINRETLSLDLYDLERQLTKGTKAIVIVHWGGVTLDLDMLDEILEKHRNLYGYVPWVIEDCAHAFGTKWNEHPLPYRDDLHLRFYSFQAIKHLTCGDGGCLVVPTQEMYRRGKLLRWYGIDRENNSKDFRCEADVPEWGYKFHMNDINATIGLHNMQDIDLVIEKHISNALYYHNNINDERVEKLNWPLDCDPSFWLYTILVDRKDSFMDHMKKHNIVVSRVHERNDKHSCVKQFRTHLPALDDICEHMVCIPVGWWVSEADRKYIVDVIHDEDW